MIEKVKLSESKEIYEKYMSQDFKENEIPELDDFIKLIEEEKSKVYIFKKENKKVAYFITMEVDKFILITHLAVIKEFRGKGLGKEFLKNIKKWQQIKKS